MPGYRKLGRPTAHRKAMPVSYTHLKKGGDDFDSKIKGNL